MKLPVKLSSDLCAGVSLVGGITAAVFGLMSILLAIWHILLHTFAHRPTVPYPEKRRVLPEYQQRSM